MSGAIAVARTEFILAKLYYGNKLSSRGADRAVAPDPIPNARKGF